MTWDSFIRWLSSWFVHDDTELKQILAGQAELRGLLQTLLNQESDQLKIDSITEDVKSKTDQLKTVINRQRDSTADN